MTSGEPALDPGAVTCGELLRAFRGQLTEQGFESARLEAALLISHRSGFSLAQLYTHPEQTIPFETVLQLQNDLKRRLQQEPIAYILGSAEFFGLPFIVGPGVLIPRADTERLVETAVEQIVHEFKSLLADQKPLDILDTCTGSGCVGITVALELCRKGYGVGLTLVDTDPIAAEYARKNLELLLGRHLDQQVEPNSDKRRETLKKAGFETTTRLTANFVLADLWPTQMASPAQNDGRYDLITANPPYIVSQEIPGLMADVTNFEPHLALDGGEDGLDIYRRLIREAPTYLNTPGLLLMEHGYDQTADVTTLLKDYNFTDVWTAYDYSGHPRVTGGWLR